jgi:hypothetical protein
VMSDELITGGTQAGGTPGQSSAKLIGSHHSALTLGLPAGPAGVSTETVGRRLVLVSVRNRFVL